MSGFEEVTIGNARLILGDCREVLPTLAPVSAVVTDPPYGLRFMGRQWDYDVPPTDLWALVLDRLLPGGHLLAFAGTRTQHRMAVRIEDAGFEIRDMLAWVYGSGFPKSLDVGKAIDKAGGCNPAEVSSILRARREAAGMSREQVADSIGCTPSSVRDWEDGRARGKGRAVEFITPSEEYRTKLSEILGYTADERRVCGVSSDRRRDGTNYALGHSGRLTTGGHTDAAKQWDGWGTALKPAFEPITLARKPLVGTVAANVMEHGTGALNIDGCRVGFSGPADEAESKGKNRHADFNSGPRDNAVFGADNRPRGENGNYNPPGRWPANLIHDGSDEVVALFPLTTSVGHTPAARGRGGLSTSGHAGQDGIAERHHEAGSAARFFYCAKAAASERGDGNNHPTVKPLALMRWLLTLVATPGGLVLDPFLGSGSTGVAAADLGVRFIGIERERRYFDIACERIARAQAQGQLLPHDAIQPKDQERLF